MKPGDWVCIPARKAYFSDEEGKIRFHNAPAQMLVKVHTVGAHDLWGARPSKWQPGDTSHVSWQDEAGNLCWCLALGVRPAPELVVLVKEAM